MRLLLGFAVGLVFGVGIVMSGMANPAKVLNFFDLAGPWDPSLAFVMAGALVVAVPGYRVVLARAKPACEPAFQLPTSRRIDRSLVAGSATFGVGWGIAGFCPGGALPALGTANADVALFVGALVAGLLLARVIRRLTPPRPAAATTRTA